MAGTTNLLPWNPTAANQETDAEYTADSQRAGGATDPSVFEAALANKAFFQWSTYLTALFQAFANKGFSTSDSNLSTLTAQCSNFLTTADTKPPQVNVAYSPTPVFDGGAAQSIRFDMSGNVTSSSLINVPPAGTIVTFFIVSTSPGAFSFVWPPNVFNARSVKTQSDGNLFTQQFISDGIQFFAAETFLAVANNLINTAQSAANAAQASADAAIAKIDTLFMHIVTGSRSLATTYTNTSGAPITVSIVMVRGGGSGDTQLNGFVNNNMIASNTTTSTIAGATLGITFVVPNGANYGATVVALSGSPSFSIEQWTEWAYA